MDLFSASDSGTHEPLAARMRPRNLDEYIGQDHIVGEGRLLRRAIQADRLTSVIFYGPPGSGKTTLARVIANHTSSNFVTLNAVLTGVQQIREAIAAADEQRKLYARRTILFVDEVHRWNRAQQDALLPWVENGTIILIGATTENPFFEVNKALVSRSRVFQLKALTDVDLEKTARAALTDKERGYGRWKVEFAQGALEHLVHTAAGDARSLLNALELAVETSVQSWPPTDDTVISIDMKTAEESIQQKVVLYDRDGDYHYDVISAFIKSLRGRDPDAALYWLARMVAAGEDPHFIFRRMLISACEDTGLADPYAISVVESCAEAFDRVGLPEGRYHLTHATLYLATAPKSNSSMAFFDALSSVEKEDTEVPNHLRDGSRDAEGFGHGQGYIYPHSYREHWAAQQYLPDPLVGKIFYTPSVQGYEGKIRDEVLTRRELQIAAIMESDITEKSGNGVYDRFYFGIEGKKKEFTAPHGEILTFSPGGTKRDEWTRRLDSGKSETLLAIRNELMQRASLLRHERVLVFGADDGLLIWEAGRRVPEGLAAGLCRSKRGKELLEQYAASLDELDRPEIRVIPETEVNSAANSKGILKPNISGQTFDTPFDCVLARDPGFTEPALIDFVQEMMPRCTAKGRIVFSCRIPAQGMRLSSLLQKDDPTRPIAEKAEAKLYEDHSIPVFAWNEKTVSDAFAAAGYRHEGKTLKVQEPRRIQTADIQNWFNPETSPYGAIISTELGIQQTELFRKKLENRINLGPQVWEYTILFCTVRFSDK